MDPHKVAVHAYEGIAAFELGVVVEVFALPRPELEVERWYDFALFSETPGRLNAVGGFGLDVPHGLEALDDAGTVILLGSPDPRATHRPRSSARCVPRTAAGRGSCRSARARSCSPRPACSTAGRRRRTGCTPTFCRSASRGSTSTRACSTSTVATC